jgi:hypothetical protein
MKKLLIKLPRKFRVWWGEMFIYMLGKCGTNEFNDDFLLYLELQKWLDLNKKI